MLDQTNRLVTPSRVAHDSPRKPYVRIVTEKRREQNRRAQKAYRDKLKKKLEDLEEQAAATNIQTDTSVASTDSSAADGDPSLVSSPTHAPLDPHIINLADAFVAAGDLPFGQGPIPGLQFHIGSDISSPASDVVLHEHADYGDLDLKHIWAVPDHSRTNHPHHGGLPTYPAKSSTALMALTPQSTHRHSPASLHLPSPPHLGDPYKNHMRLVGEGNIEASITVALAVGITRSQYINDQPSHFPSCYVALNCPRYPGQAPVNYKLFDTFVPVMPALQEHMDTVTPVLRPTRTQLLQPHPAYLDCIVFPHVREHAVRASVDGILDHADLFTDLMHGGLVCWGAMSGLSNRHSRNTKAGKRDMRESVAWSARSWEAKRWFLRKWAWLIGTEEEEEARGDVDGIWRGSRWWWAMRGEDDSDDDGEEGGDGRSDERFCGVPDTQHLERVTEIAGHL